MAEVPEPEAPGCESVACIAAMEQYRTGWKYEAAQQNEIARTVEKRSAAACRS
jgi:hypothetical protein